MDRQTLRHRVLRFNADGPSGLVDRWWCGPARRLNDDQLRELAGIVEAGPDVHSDGVVRWRRVDLQALIKERFGVADGERWVSQILHDLSFSHTSARPAPQAGCPGDPGVQKNFGRTLKGHIAGLKRGKPIEIWFQDEARIGQKNGLARLWARTGTRPRQPADQRYKSAYLFGTTRAARHRCGPGDAARQHSCHAASSQRHQPSRGCPRTCRCPTYRAGWHTTDKLKLPANLTIILPPSRSPELNPVENVWQYLRQNWLSYRVFPTYDAILDAACQAWNRLVDQPDTISSIGMRKWAHIV